jgi:hypothetical protein
MIFIGCWIEIIADKIKKLLVERFPIFILFFFEVSDLLLLAWGRVGGGVLGGRFEDC